MQFGVIFPQTEIGDDPSGVRDYAQAAEEIGYAHILAYDHVLGADPNRGGPWPGPYTDKHPFHEVFVLYGFLAGLTRTIVLATGILILPQRQTALVAKQAAAIDVLSGGRLRLGIGIGWNYVEYEALDVDFHTRGRRVSEQIEVLRRLWTEPLVDFRGRYHSITRAGVLPLPVQRPIPIWMGGGADAVLRRVARYADGWIPGFRPNTENATLTMEKLRAFLRDANRDLSELSIEGRMNVGSGTPDEWRAAADEWRAIGATHISVNTMNAGLDSPAAHINQIRRAYEALT
jgi:probable F420-dependent oxidoreductase